MKQFISILLFGFSLSIFAQGVYPPAAGTVGTTAIYKDSSVFKDWASTCIVKRGLLDIAFPLADTVSVGEPKYALGKADGNLVVSLGDGGEAVVTFNGKLFDGVGPDFAVFENAFNTTFLELAFVEVSSDGLNYFRFPSHSLTDTSKAVGSFGMVEASNLHNLAGKYQANYGTPFDLHDLIGESNLDVQNISHIRIVDVIGTLDSTYARRDSKGRKINDQYPTPFPSGGFDLDAIGAINIKAVGLKENELQTFSLYPNPCLGVLNVDSEWESAMFRIITSEGKVVKRGNILNNEIFVEELPRGLYFIQLEGRKGIESTKFMKR